MSVTLPIEIQEGRLDHADAELLVTPFFESHRPLRGPAARVDWRLCGLLSDQLAAGRATGARGEAILLATGGRFRVPSVMAFGLGPKPGFSERDLRLAAKDLVGRIAGLRVARVAVALPDEIVLGFTIEQAAAAIVGGMAEGLAERPAAFRLQLYAGERPGDARTGAERGARTAPDGIEIRLGTPHAERVARPTDPPRRPSSPARRPTGVVRDA